MNIFQHTQQSGRKQIIQIIHSFIEIRINHPRVFLLHVAFSEAYCQIITSSAYGATEKVTDFQDHTGADSCPNLGSTHPTKY